MKKFSMPFRVGFILKLDRRLLVVRHVDVGTNRLQVEDQATKVRENLKLTDQFANLFESRAQLVDSDGVIQDFSAMSADVLALSPKKRVRFQLRLELVKKLHVLGRLSPDAPAVVSAVETFNAKFKTAFKTRTAYGWLLTYRKHGFKALATPRAKRARQQGPPGRMHRLTRLALDAVLQEETSRIEERLKAQRGVRPIQGRAGLSLRGITLLARARVLELHAEEHKKVNEKLAEQGLELVPLPEPPAGPSNRTVQLEMLTHKSRWAILAADIGVHATKKRLGPFGKNFGLTRICERWETDLFIADIIISVYYQGVLVPVGIPYILAMVDCYSGVVVGMIVEFRPPNYESFLALCKQAFTPKAWLFQKFPGIKNPIEIYGVCEVIAYDNAGMFSKQGQVHEAQATVGSMLEPASPYSPNHKPFAESFGAVMGRTMVRHQPGNKKSIAEARAVEYDAWKQPSMPMEVFTQKLWEWVWNHLHEMPMEDRHGWSRRQTWVHSLQTLAHSEDPAEMFLLDRRQLDADIAKRHMLRYTDEGFTIDNRHYRSEEMHNLAMRYPPKFKFDVREDLCNPQRVFAVLQERDQMVEVPVASQLPDHLTSNAFHAVQEAKAAMADPKLQDLAAALLATQEGWKAPRGATYIPTSKEGLAVLLNRYPEFLSQIKPASNPVPPSQDATSAPGQLLDAFTQHFSQAAESDESQEP